ncbi:acetamidase/formamidase family protein [Paraglaciecola marina]|uniref:acetamidase/formamidase family protein n=1 Tax=Paraglaciecola marina TaxID=2500157 RepID=UPI00105C8A9A|nr:acetamidase/formamidase family protein [Paraglaciecola marina]
MQNRSWSYSTDSHSKMNRLDSWQAALGKLGLFSEYPGSLEDFYADMHCMSTPKGIEFTRIRSGAQNIIAKKENNNDGVWVAFPLEGRMTIQEGDRSFEVIPGDLVFGAMGSKTSLTLHSDFRQLFVTIPNIAFNARLIAPLPTHMLHLPGHSGPAQTLVAMLVSLANNLETITEDQLRPIELAIPEFLIAALFPEADTRTLGGAAGVKAAMLHRICQGIEVRLSNPDLNLNEVAREHKISPRYLQKLFESVDQSFSRYIRNRRLERCKDDLDSPVHAQLSISEICFRWGFNDSAYFSRSFKDYTKMSPREYRKRSKLKAAKLEELHQTRGRPATATSVSLDESELRNKLDTSASLSSSQALTSAQQQASNVHHYIPVNKDTIHWGYFDKDLPPVLTMNSHEKVTIETLTHHAYDDYARMIKDDPGAESVFKWTKDQKNVDRRGAGPADASVYGRGSGEGFGVHVCTGPIYVNDAMPGDIIELRILDIQTRHNNSEQFKGRSFGSNAATFWGFHYNDLLTEPKPREVVTIYEIDESEKPFCAHAVYNYRWVPQTDPFGVTHDRIDYPGVPVDHSKTQKNFDILQNVEIPLRPHFGTIGLAPNHSGLVDSVPPSNQGGNLDNWRLAKDSKVFLPVAVAGGLLSVGDPHASQGDSELCGTAIECSLTGVFQVILHKQENIAGRHFDVDFPLIETDTEWVILGFSHPNYLKELGDNAQSDIYSQSTIDLAMRDAFRKARRFLMNSQNLSEDEAISLLSVAVDFGVTQVVDGNWGVHAVIPKTIFTNLKENEGFSESVAPSS